MPKNIEMNYKNDSGSYDILWPENTSEISMLSQNLNTMFQLTNGTVEDVLQILGINDGYSPYLYKIRLLDPSGNPVQGVLIEGLNDVQGYSRITDKNGYATGGSSSKSVTVSASTDYVDWVSASKKITISSGIYVEGVLQYTINTNKKLIVTTSGDTITFSNQISTIDLYLIGGGGSGGVACPSEGVNNAGTGGGGAYIQHYPNLSLGADKTVKINSIGAGGASATVTTTQNGTRPSANGISGGSNSSTINNIE